MDLQSPEINEIAAALLAPFPEAEIHWRAQSLTKQSPYKALALAYIDSRHVQSRLDAVMGISGWQCEYKHDLSGKTSCGIGLLLPTNAGIYAAKKAVLSVSESETEWIWKWDGAGDTQVEAEKGAYSDSFKRAAVKWGIGRYLYDMPAQWIPCETYERGGKQVFSKFTEDPWKNVPRKPEPPKPAEFPQDFTRDTEFWIAAEINGCSYKGTKFEDLPDSVCEQIANSSLEGVSESRGKAIEFANQEWAIRVEENTSRSE